MGAAWRIERMMSVHEKVNILMVDDQPGKLLSYEAILADLGENLIKATSAKEALEKLLKTDVAVVLMDVSMPEIDGFELAEIIRQHPRFQKTAIIFVSAVHLDRPGPPEGISARGGGLSFCPDCPGSLAGESESVRRTAPKEAATGAAEQRTRAARRGSDPGVGTKSTGAAAAQSRSGPEEPGTGRDCADRSRYYFQPASGRREGLHQQPIL